MLLALNDVTLSVLFACVFLSDTRVRKKGTGTKSEISNFNPCTKLGDSACGQRALYQMGLTGIPIYNVNNNCATGSSALFMANQLIAGGIADCVLALGFEKMQRGSLSSQV